MELSPNMLRDAAAYLAIDHSTLSQEFMCLCLSEALETARLETRVAAKEEFYWLLDEHGIDTSGSLIDSCGVMLLEHLNGDEFAVQCVRFDLLHLLAHYLEG